MFVCVHVITQIQDWWGGHPSSVSLHQSDFPSILFLSLSLSRSSGLLVQSAPASMGQRSGIEQLQRKTMGGGHVAEECPIDAWKNNGQHTKRGAEQGLLLGTLMPLLQAKYFGYCENIAYGYWGWWVVFCFLLLRIWGYLNVDFFFCFRYQNNLISQFVMCLFYGLSGLAL